MRRQGDQRTEKGLLGEAKDRRIEKFEEEKLEKGRE